MNRKMENILKSIYKSVESIDKIIIDLINSEKLNIDLNEDFKHFCQKTFIVSNNCLNYSQLFDDKTNESFETLIIIILIVNIIIIISQTVNGLTKLIQKNI